MLGNLSSGTPEIVHVDGVFKILYSLEYNSSKLQFDDEPVPDIIVGNFDGLDFLGEIPRLRLALRGVHIEIAKSLSRFRIGNWCQEYNGR